MKALTLALVLLTLPAQAAEWETFIEFNVWSPPPPGVPQPTVRNYAWWGDGRDPFETRSEVKLNIGETLPAGTTVEIYWDPSELEPCPACKAGQYQTGWLMPSYMTLTTLPGEAAYQLHVTTTQGPYTTVRYVDVAYFWWLGNEPTGDANDLDIWLDELPFGTMTHGVSYQSLGAACNADIDGNGTVGSGDYLALGMAYGQSCQP